MHPTKKSRFALARQFGNDYSELELNYSLKTHSNLVSRLDDKQNNTIPLSIIMPSYNSHDVLKTILESLEYQIYKNFEVILVDDGSEIPLKDIVDSSNFTFDFKYIRIPTNRDHNPNRARNIGLSIADSNNIISLDSDMIPAKFSLVNIANRLALFDKCVFLGFRDSKKSWDPRSNEVPNILSDWRIQTTFDPQVKYLNLNLDRKKSSFEHDIKPIHETNYLKNLGFGQSYYFWDLPSFCIGHSMAYHKSDAIDAGGFPEIFENWGMDDLAFGLNMIANNNYVIPILNFQNTQICNKENNFKKKLESLEENIKRYFDFAHSQEFNPFRFEKINFLKKESNKKYLEVT